ncbi:MAG: DUF418 domain-containing protein [Nostocoides sp.]
MTSTRPPHEPHVIRPRIASLDLARGLAVVSMILAHFGPVGGVWNIVERLTAPLFAMLVGVGVLLTWRRRRSTADFLVQETYRGLVLIVLGVILQTLYDQIDVVLQTLGVLSILMALLTVVLRGRVWWSAAAAAVVTLASPEVMNGARQWAMSAHLSGAGRELWGWLATGGQYRAVTFAAFALAGQALVAWVSADHRSTTLLGATLGAGTLTVLGFLTGNRFLTAPDAYSGTLGELVTALPLTWTAWLGCAWLAQILPRRWLQPLLDTGRTALTAYAVQILLARLLVDLMFGGGSDDHLSMMMIQLLVAIGGSMLWQRWLGFGPLEWLLRLPEHLSRRDKASHESAA